MTTYEYSIAPLKSRAASNRSRLIRSSKKLAYLQAPNGSNREEENKACVDAIGDEIVYRYLPEGLYHRQMNHPSGRIRLDDDQKLLIYQRVCEQIGKKSHRDTDECIAELKRPPYVNIVSFVDVCRRGGTIRTFCGPLKFCDTQGKTESI